MTFPSVIAGLDPAIHLAKPKKIRFLMDARVKPAHDEGVELLRLSIFERSQEIAR